MVTPGAKLGAPDYRDHACVAHWREMVRAADLAYGGIAWSLNRLYLTLFCYRDCVKRYVGFARPSPFKLCAAFAVSFFEERNFPIYGAFERNPPHLERIKELPNAAGAFLVYEYIRYCLHGATITRGTGDEVRLDNPIIVSPHTFADFAYAFALLRSDNAAAFHLLSLVIEQLVYQSNPEASYPRVI